MPEWLLEALHHDVTLRTDVLLLRLLAAFLMGWIAAGVYFVTLKPKHGGLAGTLVMLSVLIALVTQVIGKNEARAFTLLGALAIVRFRTIVEDSRDTAFVIFAVASGMACGAGYMLAPLACTPLVMLASWYFRQQRSGSPHEGEQRLVLRLGTASGAEQRAQAVLKERGLRYQLTALETVRGGAALDVTFTIPSLGADDALALAKELQRIDGVQGVELKDDS